jgi:exonuclease III
MASSCIFRAMSCNCRGFNAMKSTYFKTLLQSFDVLFLQEHWLSTDQLALLGDIDANFAYTGVSGFDNSDILWKAGRTVDVQLCAWRSDLKIDIVILPTGTKRMCALRVKSDAFRGLFINVYMPYEGDDDMTNDFTDQLHIVEDLINTYSDYYVIFGGDFNVDFLGTVYTLRC